MGEIRPSEIFLRMNAALTSVKNKYTLEVINDQRNAVLAEFQQAFRPERIPEIKEDLFESFLLEKNNHHWSGLHRYQESMCSNMKILRYALGILLDEESPIAERFTEAVGMVSGMGINVASAILLIAYPDRYGVWNNTSEKKGLKSLGIWPIRKRGESLGVTYSRVNQVLLLLRDNLQIDFWTLDTLWWEL